MIAVALGMGANTSIFSLVNSLLLRSLPVADPQRLALISGGDSSQNPIQVYTYAVWDAMRAHDAAFDGIRAWSMTRFDLSRGGEMRQVEGAYVSGDFFAVLGVPALLGRTVADTDDVRGSGPDGAVAVLAYTCLEGFYGAFFRAQAPGQAAPNEIITLSRWVRDHLRATIANYSDEVLNLVGQTAYAVDRARNRFSEAHFAGEAGRWLATYMRDLVNSQVRLLLHFM